MEAGPEGGPVAGQDAVEHVGIRDAVQLDARADDADCKQVVGGIAGKWSKGFGSLGGAGYVGDTVREQYPATDGYDKEHHEVAQEHSAPNINTHAFNLRRRGRTSPFTQSSFSF